MQFKCVKCGACCRLLPLFGKAYAWLDNGLGVCRFYQTDSKACSIYPVRPIICRVEEGYGHYFTSIPYDEYIQKSILACSFLKKLADG